MEYRITKEELENDWLYTTFIALSRCMAKHGFPLYVVGAVARDMAMTLLGGDIAKRRTKDLDVAVAIEDWQSFGIICETLQENHFRQIGNTQKFVYEGENGDIDYEVDVVPFGGVAVDEKICWPPEGNPVMSVKCFQDVMNEAVDVNVNDTVIVKMAPLCGQFLIKFDAWNDRNALTDKDAEDMVFILKNYHDIQLLGSENTPPEVVSYDDESLDTTIWGAQWLAYDISKLLTTEHLRFYADIINNELQKEENSNLIYHFMRYYNDNYTSDNDSCYKSCRKIWCVFEELFTKELQERSDNEN